MNDEPNYDGFGWLLIIFAIIVSFYAGLVFAAGGKWQLEVIAIDAATGEQLSEGARFTKAGLQSEFASREDCLKAHAELGGIQSHDGVAVYVVCQKVEVAKVSI